MVDNMPRRKSPTGEIRERAYKFKLKRLHTAYGQLPAELMDDVVEYVDETYAKWKARFQKYREAWRTAVLPVLMGEGEEPRVPPIEWAKYRAFVNEYISKVIEKGTITDEMIKEKYATKFNCDPSILDAIIAKLKTLG